MQRLRHLAVGLVASGLLAVGGVAATAVAANAGTIGSCGAQGDFADCVASGTANDPLTITVTVTSSPDESVTVSWDTVCSQGDGAGTSSGTFTATTPVTKTISHPYHQPDSCDVAAAGGLNHNGNWIKVSISSSSTPPIHEIKGYHGMCVDDARNSSVTGTKVQLYTCDNTVAESWTFRDGELIHNDKCANDQHNAGSGGKVILYPCSSAGNEHWTHKSNGEYVLSSHSGRLCLADPHNSTTNSTQLEVVGCNGAANERWSLP